MPCPKPPSPHLLSLCLATALIGPGPMVMAQVIGPDLSAPTSALTVEGTAASAETIQLLTALARIEADLQLGMLTLQDGAGQGAHFSEARARTYPAIKDALSRAGIADFEAELLALEAGGGGAGMTAAYTEATIAIMRARSVLRPSAEDSLRSMLDQASAISAAINPAGPTEAEPYRDAWAMLMVLRNQVDLLTRGQDPAVMTAARDLGLALDDIIIFMPDPNTFRPVSFDPAPLLQVMGGLETLAGSV